MAQTTTGAKSELMSDMESPLDNVSDYIGEAVWEKLNKSYEQTDREACKLEDELAEAIDKIDELESRIREMEV